MFKLSNKINKNGTKSRKTEDEVTCGYRRNILSIMETCYI
jgi:hypothetical protein